MKILCHRGYWRKEEEKNTYEAIKKAFESGKGIESDIRDLGGRLVIAHNPVDSSAPMAEEVFELMKEYENRYVFAINIKADGLKDMLAIQLNKYQITNYFTFDMSVPQMLEYRKSGIKYYTRQSEYEKQPVLYDEAAGVWVDAFEEDSWITEELIQEHQNNEKVVCIVSPDLHARANDDFWKRLINYQVDWNGILLCTDYPDEADNFFRKKL